MIRRRDTILGALVALILAPFQRLMEFFKPKPEKVIDDYVFGPAEFNQLQVDEPFSVSFWFKHRNCHQTLISETTLLEDLAEEESKPEIESYVDSDGWHHYVMRYEGSTSPEPEVFIDGRRLGDPEPEGIDHWGQFKDNNDTPPALS